MVNGKYQKTFVPKNSKGKAKAQGGFVEGMKNMGVGSNGVRDWRVIRMKKRKGKEG